VQIGVAHTKGRRTKMEDRHLPLAQFILTFSSGEKNAILSAIFDGHGGSQFADFLSEQLPRWFMTKFNRMKEIYQDEDTIIYNALIQAIVEG